jgi:hypothetical protein
MYSLHPHLVVATTTFDFHLTSLDETSWLNDGPSGYRDPTKNHLLSQSLHWLLDRQINKESSPNRNMYGLHKDQAGTIALELAVSIILSS